MERTKILVGILLSLASNGGPDSVLSVDSYQWPVGVSVSVSARVKTGILRNDIAPPLHFDTHFHLFYYVDVSL